MIQRNIHPALNAHPQNLTFHVSQTVSLGKLLFLDLNTALPRKLLNHNLQQLRAQDSALSLDALRGAISQDLRQQDLKLALDELTHRRVHGIVCVTVWLAATVERLCKFQKDVHRQVRTALDVTEDGILQCLNLQRLGDEVHAEKIVESFF